MEHFTELFNEEIVELNQLPYQPKAFWGVSAGEDFRAPIYFNSSNCRLEKPDLFIYNCIGNEAQKFKNTRLLLLDFFKFDKSPIKLKLDIRRLTLKSHLNLGIISNRIDEEQLQYNEIAVYYIQLEDSVSRNVISHLLYFVAENIEFFEKIILQNYFRTLYFSVYNEGMGYGHCQKSIIEYIYKDNYPNCFADNGFKPEYLFLDGSPRKTEIIEPLNNSNNVVCFNQIENFNYPPRVAEPSIEPLKYKFDDFLFKAFYNI